ncbi:unnamed protein product [Dovyalis caffra]|uniref:Uncharacterized protein n=1 Tax=Dovyalis caffra TaxID=77055 RepID=A0AAV1SID9_9ROSI|nr:unnamed protein product [Dovyalis caffra]
MAKAVYLRSTTKVPVVMFSSLVSGFDEKVVKDLIADINHGAVSMSLEMVVSAQTTCKTSALSGLRNPQMVKSVIRERRDLMRL